MHRKARGHCIVAGAVFQILLLWGIVSICGSSAFAQTHELENSLPAETIALVAVPDQKAALASFAKTPVGKLWNHPEMEPFWKTLCTQLGIPTADSTNRWASLFPIGSLKDKFSSLYLACLSVPDSPLFPELGVSPVLGIQIETTQLEIIRKLLSDLASNPQTASFIKTNAVGETVLFGLPFSQEKSELLFNFFGITFPNKDESGKKPMLTFWLTIVDGHLLVELNTTAGIELILKARNPEYPKLAQQPEWQKHRERFADSVLWGWAHLSPIVQKWIEHESQEIEQIAKSDAAAPAETEDGPLISMPAVTSKLGLESFLSASIYVLDSPAGIRTDYFISSPETGRTGVAKLIAIEAGICAPPSFVTEDVLRFSRMRLDIQTAWTAAEKMVDEIMPDVRDLLAEALLPGLREANPDFDLKAKLITPLGKDVILCETQTASGEKQIIRFIQITEGKQYIETVEEIISILAPIPSLKTEVGHYKITSLPLPDFELNPGAYKTNYCHLAFKDGFLAFSTERALVEKFLEPDTNLKKLSERDGLNAATLGIGGFSTGFFKYSNSREIARTCYNRFRNFSQQERDDPLVFPLFTLFSQDIPINLAFIKKMTSLAPLPEFDKLADCFDFSVSVFQSTPDGFTMRTLLPTATVLNTPQAEAKPEEVAPPPAPTPVEVTPIPKPQESTPEFPLPTPEPTAPLPPEPEMLPAIPPSPTPNTNSVQSL